MPAVVADTSVLITLAAGEQFHLLREFYGAIYIPPAVWKEVTASAKPFGLPQAQQARQAGWLIVQSPAQPSVDRVRTLPFVLQPGELEALALALDLTGALLVVDDAQGRRAAQSLGLAYTGSLGILLRGKAEGKIPARRPVLERLKQRTSFWLSETVYQTALNQAGETW
jgi:predicted nucleic acid-binding protein